MRTLCVSPDRELALRENGLIEFLKNEWETYDDQPVTLDSKLQLFDNLLSILMNSRLDTATKVQSVWRGKGSAEKVLAEIPANLPLTSDAVPWEILQRLYESFCAPKWSGPAMATKILHKKRPLLIPMLDAVVWKYLENSGSIKFRWGASIGERMVLLIKCFRDQLLHALPEVERLCLVARAAGYPITQVRCFEILIWIDQEPNGYYHKELDSYIY